MSIASFALGLACSLSTAPQQGWNLDHLARRIPVAQQSRKDALPLLAWQLPELPQTNAAVPLKDQGRLTSRVVVVSERGIVPLLNLSGVSQGPGIATMDGVLALAATLTELELPVHVFANPPAWVASGRKLPNGQYHRSAWDYWPEGEERWFEYDGPSGQRQWPVFPLATPSHGYAGFRHLLDLLAAGNPDRGLAGVRSLDGLWMDYEDLPHPWNAARESQLSGSIDGHAVAGYYGITSTPFPGADRSVKSVYSEQVLSSHTVFMQYASDLRSWLLTGSMHRALREVYGSRPIVGGYGDVYSSPTSPHYDLNGGNYPVHMTVPDGAVAMPIVYANNRFLRKHLGGKGQPPADRRHADAVYWHQMLRSFSSSAANAPAMARSVPWVSQYVRDDDTGQLDLPMSPELYRELLRHLWLRGAKGMFVFNPFKEIAGAPDAVDSYMSASYSLEQLHLAAAIQDEMRLHRAFLEHGRPMNLTWQPMFDRSPQWSGLAHDGAAVVRLFSWRDGPDRIDRIEVPGGATFRDLYAPPEGATYLLRRNGTLARVTVPKPPRLKTAAK